MVWGWIRRRRTEGRLADATTLLGRQATLSPDRQSQLLEKLSSALEARDPYTHGHSKRVTRHAQMIARQMGLPRDLMVKVRTAAAVHDVGKLKTPREVINKPGKLTDEEFATIKRHAPDGAEMVSGMGDPEITAIVRHHHERLDGRGYPDGLRGADIPLGARIIAVADTFDALTSNRPYRTAFKHKRAIDILKKEAGSQLDPAAVAAFLSYYSGRRPVAWWAMASEAPPRFLQWLWSSLQGAGAAPLAKGLSSAGAAALIGSSLAAPAIKATAEQKDAANARSAQVIAEAARRHAKSGLAASGETGRSDVGGGTRSDDGRRRPAKSDSSGPGSGSGPGSPGSHTGSGSDLSGSGSGSDGSGSGSDGSGSGSDGSDSGSSGSGSSGSGSSGSGSGSSGPGSGLPDLGSALPDLGSGLPGSGLLGSGSSGSSGSGSSGSGSSGSGSGR
jgi:putative nucleotidyltransferase with HDIG domain